MDPEKQKRLKELCERMTVETDRERFLALVTEANQLFDEKLENVSEGTALKKGSAA